MKNLRLNYDVLISVSRSLSKSKDPDEIIRMTVESLKKALAIKGCSLFLMNNQSNELEVAASSGLSEEYLYKGPVSALHSIADSLEDGPIAVYDVSDDPRIQYPEDAKKEGIASILSVPVMIGDDAIGAIRAYTAEKWEFTLDDGSKVSLKGDEEVEYDGEMHTAANLYDALKEGYYGKF